MADLKTALADRSPRYDGGNRVWFWRCANEDATLEQVVKFSANLLPWEVYWAMPGSPGAYVADYPTEEAARDALAKALEKLGVRHD
jgi:hypothetical protein